MKSVINILKNYRGYTLIKADNGISIYDENNCYVETVKTRFVCIAEKYVDYVIQKNGN